jgi:hypothetical protein
VKAHGAPCSGHSAKQGSVSPQMLVGGSLLHQSSGGPASADPASRVAASRPASEARSGGPASSRRPASSRGSFAPASFRSPALASCGGPILSSSALGTSPSAAERSDCASYPISKQPESNVAPRIEPRVRTGDRILATNEPFTRRENALHRARSVLPSRRRLRLALTHTRLLP